MNNKRINIELAIEKGLVTENNYDVYKKLENYYKYLFEKYLMKKVDLKKYDDEIDNSGLYFSKSSLGNKLLTSGLEEYLDMNYIYILNNFFIEKLSNEEIKLLSINLNNSNYELSDELYSLIDRTYKEVIRNNYSNGKYDERVYNICYGVAIPSNFASNDSLVMKIVYSKNSSKLDDKEFIKNIRDKKKFLEDLIVRLQEEINSKLNINCNILSDKVPK